MDLVVLRWVLLVFWGLLLSFKDLNSGGVVALLRWIQGFRGSGAQRQGSCPVQSQGLGMEGMS